MRKKVGYQLDGETIQTLERLSRITHTPIQRVIDRLVAQADGPSTDPLIRLERLANELRLICQELTLLLHDRGH